MLLPLLNLWLNDSSAVLHYDVNETDIASRTRYFPGELVRKLKLDHLPYFCLFASGCTGFISLLVLHKSNTSLMECSIERTAWRRIRLFRWQNFIEAKGGVFTLSSTMELGFTLGFACSRRPT
jgi:hypothetical protein